MYTTKQYLTGFCLLLTTAFSSWLVLKSSPNEEINVSTHANQPDSIMKNATLLRMNNETGKLQDKLEAAVLTHYPTGDLTNFTQPHFTIMRENEAPWVLTADEGQAHDGIDTIKLWGHVVLTQAGGLENLPTTITTSAITIFPKKEYAETDQAAKATQPDRMMQAIGMVVHFKTGIVDLASNVQGQYKE